MTLTLALTCGKNCEQNSVEAQKWFEVAANQGDADAQFNLGIMLHEARDAASAFRWFKEAATQGNPWAQDNFNLMSGTGEQKLLFTYTKNLASMASLLKVHRAL